MSFSKKLLILFSIIFCIVLLSIACYADQTYGDYTYTIANSSVTITGYNGSDDIVYIPSSIDGIPINAIAKDAFKTGSCKAIVLPDCITSTQSFPSDIVVVFTNGGTWVESSHLWDDGRVTLQSTCTTAGTREFTCLLCNEQKTESMPLTSHTFGNGTISTAPTCAAEGYIEFKCQSCDAVEVETIDKLSTHTYSSSCDDTCEICGSKRSVTHTPSSSYVYDATNHYAYCTVCGAKCASSAHTTTTDSEGKTYCSVCGYIVSLPRNHVHDIIKVDAKKATCTEQGNSEYYKCSECGMIFSDSGARSVITSDKVNIAPTGHKSAISKAAVAPTQSREGSTAEYSCSVCGIVLTKSTTIAKLPTTKNEVDKAKPADTDGASTDANTANTVFPDDTFIAIDTNPTDSALSNDDVGNIDDNITVDNNTSDETGAVKLSANNDLNNNNNVIALVISLILVCALVGIALFKVSKSK